MSHCASVRRVKMDSVCFLWNCIDREEVAKKAIEADVTKYDKKIHARKNVKPHDLDRHLIVAVHTVPLAPALSTF